MLWLPKPRRMLRDVFCAFCGKPYSLARRLIFPAMLSATHNIGPCACCGAPGVCDPTLEEEDYGSMNLTIGGWTDTTCSVVLGGPFHTCGETTVTQHEYTWSALNGGYSTSDLSVFGDSVLGFFHLGDPSDYSTAGPALVQKTYNYSCGGGTWNNFGITEYYVTQLAAAIYCTECDDGTSYACINGQSHGGAVGAYSLTLHSWTYSAPGSGSGAGTLLGTSSACLRIGGFFPPCTGDPETGNDLFCGQFTGTFPCNASADYLRSGVERQVNCSVEGIQTILEDPTAAISLSC